MRLTSPPGAHSHTPKPQPKGSRLKEPYYFVVGGSGWFPDDMLRYDQAWALTGRNFGGDDPRNAVQKERSVIIASWLKDLTIARWNSFGWGVIDQRIERPAFLDATRLRLGTHRAE